MLRALSALEVTFLLVSTGAILPIALSVECSVNELENCLIDLRGSHSRLGKEVIPNFPDDQLAGLCRDLKDAQPCMLVVEELCEVNNTNPVKVLQVTQRLQEINNGHDFICQVDRNEEYRKVVRTCADEKKEELADLEQKCHDMYHNITWYLNKENPDNVHIFCKAAKKYMTCVMEGVLPLCGQEVAIWAKSFHESLWESHLKHISCDPEGGMEAGAVVIVTLCAGALVYCIICVVGSFIQERKVCIKSGKKHRKDGKGEYVVQTQTSSDL